MAAFDLLTPSFNVHNLFYDIFHFCRKLDAEKRGTVKRLEKKRHEIRQWTIEELKKEIEKYESH